MMIKKINSLLSLVLCTLLLIHMIVTGLVMAHRIPWQPWVAIISYTLLCVLIVHLIFAVVPLLLNHDGTKEKAYLRLNLRCYLQRICGIAIIVFIHPHFYAFTAPPVVVMKNLLYLAAMIALVFFCCFHMSVSIPKALVGLGCIVEEKTLVRAERISFVCVFAIGIFTIWCACQIAGYSGLFGGGL